MDKQPADAGPHGPGVIQWPIVPRNNDACGGLNKLRELAAKAEVIAAPGHVALLAAHPAIGPRRAANLGLADRIGRLTPLQREAMILNLERFERFNAGDINA